MHTFPQNLVNFAHKRLILLAAKVHDVWGAIHIRLQLLSVAVSSFLSVRLGKKLC